MKKLRRFKVATHVLAVYCANIDVGVAASNGAAQAPAPEGGSISTEQETTISYCAAFFAQYPNATSVLDIIRRIPAGKRIIQSNTDSARGFATNDDRILIDGKRLTGKSNDSEAALERITIDQVDCVEVIRGQSPDVKTSGNNSLINIILKKDQRKGSGTWKADAEIVKGDHAFGGLLSYGGSIGKLEYQLSAKRTEQRRTFMLTEYQFTGRSSLDQIKRERDSLSYGQDKFSANLTYSFNDRHRIALNGLYLDWDVETRAPGSLFTPSGALTGASERFTFEDLPEWEVGGDYEAVFSDAVTFKLLGLYTDKTWEMMFGEDLLVTGAAPEDDFQFTINQHSTEAIARPSLKWNIANRHELEFGTEIAINTLDSQLAFFQRVNGALTPVNVPGANTSVKETRDESFVIHTFKPGAKATIETRLTAEYSRIEQSGDANRVRDFFFLKPGLEFRYDLTADQQIQVSAMRNVAQLDFADFAASANDDTKTFGGNTELVPEKEWKFAASYEKRFKEDAGRILISAHYRAIEDRIELIPLIDGAGNTISAVGNVGAASIMELEIEGGARLGQIGMPNVLIEPRLTLTRSRVVDPFTGLKRDLNDQRNIYFRVEGRHDLTDWGLSYGGAFAIGDGRAINDVDETSHKNDVLFMSVFAEYKLFKGVTLRLEANDLSNFDRGRDRLLYAAGVASGIVTSRELLEKREGRVYNIGLRGNF